MTEQTTQAPSKIKRTFRFITESLTFALHPFKSWQKYRQEKELKKYEKRFQTDPAYVSELLDPKPPKPVVPKNPANLIVGLVTVLVFLVVGWFMTSTVFNIQSAMMNSSLLGNSTMSSNETQTENFGPQTILYGSPFFFALIVISFSLFLMYQTVRKAGFL